MEDKNGQKKMGELSPVNIPVQMFSMGDYVGIREKQFICAARISDQERIMEIRYNVGSQKWTIFQFLA